MDHRFLGRRAGSAREPFEDTSAVAVASETLAAVGTLAASLFVVVGTFAAVVGSRIAGIVGGTVHWGWGSGWAAGTVDLTIGGDVVVGGANLLVADTPRRPKHRDCTLWWKLNRKQQ